MAKELPPFESFSGQLLIGAQNTTGNFFDRSVVLITEHTAQGGATGYVLNRPLKKLTPADIFKERDISWMAADFTLKNGGPVDLSHGSILHSDEYHALDTHPLFHGIAITETQQILDDIANKSGPQHFIIFVGKSAWAPGQLEEEIMGNMWILAPFSFNLIFNTPDEKKWQDALATLKIDANLLANNAGKA